MNYKITIVERVFYPRKIHSLERGKTLTLGIFRRIFEKPWLDQDDQIQELQTSTFRAHNRKVALVVFLFVVGSVFFLLFAAAHMRIVLATDWVPMPEPDLLWINTIILVLVSIALEVSRHDINKNKREKLFSSFLTAGLLTALFIVLQYFAWMELVNLGYAAQRNPANAFFYVLTAFHTLHLVGGLIAWWRALVKIRSHEVEYAEVRLGVELCAIYWHFLLFVWIIILALFIST